MSNIILTYNNKIIDYTSVVPFSPLDYTPIAWYDSSDVSTITKDISDKVSEWRDKSGLGYHLAQSVDLNKPLYSAVNGIVFDGVNDYMSKVFGISYTQPITYFLVWRNNNSSLVVPFSNNVNNFGLITNRTGANEIEFYTNTWQNGVIKYNKTAPYTIITTIVEQQPNSSIYENNVLKNTNSIPTLNLSGLFIGDFWGGGYNLNGWFKELIIYNSALTTDQITTVNNYLNSKYIIY